MAAVGDSKSNRIVLVRAGSEAVLPLDHKSVEVELYLRVAGLDHDVHYTAYPYSPMTGVLPQIQFGRSVASATESVRYLALDHCDVDQSLSATHRAEAYAFRTLIDQALPPALVSEFCISFTD